MKRCVSRCLSFPLNSTYKVSPLIAPPSRMRIWIYAMGVGVSIAGGCGETNVYEPPKAPTVTVAKPVQKSVTLYIEENGRTEAVQRAEVRARVSGFLKEIRFIEGKDVEEDQVLYLIEQREYVAARDASNAILETAEVAVRLTQTEFERQETLLKKTRPPKANGSRQRPNATTRSPPVTKQKRIWTARS